jgi:hypothetical protein
MTLKEQVTTAINDFENVSAEQFLEILDQIMPEFKSNLTSEYLRGKIQKILEVDGEPEKKKQCKALMPYLDWYLQGL